MNFLSCCIHFFPQQSQKEPWTGVEKIKVFCIWSRFAWKSKKNKPKLASRKSGFWDRFWHYAIPGPQCWSGSMCIKKRRAVSQPFFSWEGSSFSYLFVWRTEGIVRDTPQRKPCFMLLRRPQVQITKTFYRSNCWAEICYPCSDCRLTCRVLKGFLRHCSPLCLILISCNVLLYRLKAILWVTFFIL